MRLALCVVLLAAVPATAASPAPLARVRVLAVASVATTVAGWTVPAVGEAALLRGLAARFTVIGPARVGTAMGAARDPRAAALAARALGADAVLITTITQMRWQAVPVSGWRSTDVIPLVPRPIAARGTLEGRVLAAGDGFPLYAVAAHAIESGRTAEEAVARALDRLVAFAVERLIQASR